MTFHVGAGALTITAPASADLGSGFPNTTIGPSHLGTIHVDDTRGTNPSNWTVTVNATGDFTNGSGGTIPVSAAFYEVGIVDTVNVASLSKFNVTLSTSPQTIITASSTGGNHAAWDPTLTVHVPLSALAGDYSTTLVHSVA